jgi:outer membrane protein assembly factor BamB
MMAHRNQKHLAALVAIALAGCVTTARADWPNFRGPNHDGISEEKGFKTQWTGSIPLRWEKAIGSAFSSLACVGDKVYTCGTQADKQVTFCLNADTGDVVWQRPIEEAFPDSSGGDGTRATPTLDDGRVYILGARGTLLCLDAAGGEEVWKTHLKDMPKWGFSGSVLIEGNLAIATAGSSEGALVAFDKKTGKVAWRCGSDIAGYATPYPFTFQGKRYITGFTGVSAVIADAATGRLMWQTPWKTAWNVNASSPIFHDGYLFLSSGYDTGCELFKLRVAGEELEAESVWKSDVLLNKFQSCILYEGNLYASDQKALVCVDFLTGKELWRKRRIKHGTLILADGHLILLTQEGRLQIAKVSPAGFEPQPAVDILKGRCWTVPVLHRGRLYARNLERLVCLDLK